MVCRARGGGSLARLHRSLGAPITEGVVTGQPIPLISDGDQSTPPLYGHSLHQRLPPACAPKWWREYKQCQLAGCPSGSHFADRVHKTAVFHRGKQERKGKVEGGEVQAYKLASRRRSHPQGIVTTVSPFGAESFATTSTSPIFRTPWPSCVRRAGPRRY